jgi:pimeloyl-ACP methyl ester carboxylesterase
LRHPSARGMSVWLIRGVPSAGGLVPDGAVPEFRELLGSDRVITIADAPHSPQRTHPHATALAILQSLAD